MAKSVLYFSQMFGHAKGAEVFNAMLNALEKWWLLATFKSAPDLMDPM